MATSAHPPLNPEVIFRQALNFDYSGQLLSNATGSLLMARVASGEFANSPISAPTEAQTPGGLLIPLPKREPTNCVTVPPQALFGLPTLIPTLVLQAFATELYLKCILVLNTGDAPHVHQLVQLYQQLTPTQKTRVEELYNAECQSDLAFQGMQGTEPTTTFTLVYALQEMNRAFEAWRYAYESVPEKSFLGHPWIAAARLILELRPDWLPIVAALGVPPSFQVR